MSSNIITVLIADDEKPARNRLKSLLKEHNNFQIVAEAENGDEVLSMLISKSPQVAFLDINMPGASVFSTIPSLKNPPLIIFQTAYSEYGVKAFDINAVDYLLKPISKERFKTAIEKLQLNIGLGSSESQAENKNESIEIISIKSGDSIRVIKVKHIHKISFEDGFSFIYSGAERIYSDKSLNYYDELLKNSGFYRVSRTDIINISYISKLHPMFKGQYSVELKSNERINISRRRLQGLKELLALK